MNVTAIIPAKGTSKRLPDKNMQGFAGSTLVGHKIEQLKQCRHIDDIVVATDCEKIAAEAKLHGASVRMQDAYHCDEDQCPLKERWRNIVARVETDVVVWAHCTNPLCTPDLYDWALEAFYIRSDDRDSLCSVTKIQRHAWKFFDWLVASEKNEPERYRGYQPVNFDPWGDRHPFASELDPYYFQNGAIFIQPHRQMLENAYFYGENPFLFEINQPHDLDIDTQEDLDLAKMIWRGMEVAA